MEVIIGMSNEPKIYAAVFMFNYFGKEKIEDKVIAGANIEVAFRPYKDGKIVKFGEEKETYLWVENASSLTGTVRDFISFEDLVNVSYSEKDCYKISYNDELIELYMTEFGWDRIDISVSSVSLAYFDDSYMIETFECGTKIFEEFLKTHSKDFDISDNKKAQCPAYCWIDESLEGDNTIMENNELVKEIAERNKIDQSVVEHVSNYFTDKNNSLTAYELVDVVHKSNHPEDDYLYMVVAKKGDEYAVWTSWNDTMQSLNFGHYGLAKESVEDVLNEYFNNSYEHLGVTKENARDLEYVQNVVNNARKNRGR